MRSIGIPVANRPECVVALDVAFQLGQALASDIVGYHIRPNREDSMKIDLAGLFGSGALAGTAWPEESDKDKKAAAVSARQLFVSMAEKYSLRLSERPGSEAVPHGMFKEKVGAPEKLIPLFGPTNDLLVVSRPKKKGGVKAWLILMSALLDSVAPVLVLPQKKVKAPCKRLAIAWNRGKTESRLVHAVLPLLKAAEDVVFITEGKDHNHGPTARDMAEFLKAHGIKARTRRVMGKDTARTLLDAAKQEQSDTLLCGAYTRGRVREMLFGGVTEYLITQSDFPVILMHT